MRDGADYKGKEAGMEVDEEKALLERRTPVLSQAHLQPAHPAWRWWWWRWPAADAAC